MKEICKEFKEILIANSKYEDDFESGYDYGYDKGWRDCKKFWIQFMWFGTCAGSLLTCGIIAAARLLMQ